MKLLLYRYLIKMIICVFTVFFSYQAMSSEINTIKDRAKEFALNEAKLIIDKANIFTTNQFINFLRKEIKETIAINYMALWVLGNNRFKFTHEQLDRFILEFHNHLSEFYGSILYQWKDQPFTLNNVKEVGTDKAVVEFVVPLKKQKLLVGWQLRLEPKTGKFLVTDIVINGISFLQAKRTEYNAFFKECGGDPENFLNMLVKNNKQNKSNIQNVLPK